MAQKTNSFERFWKELKRRKVVHVITVYAAIAFVILQLTNMVVQPLKLPDWTEAFVIVLICIGFVIAIFLSWIYDITPAGVKKTKPVSAVKPTDQTTHEVSSGWKIATYVSAIIIIALGAFNFVNRRNLNADISKLEKSIAVLPFINDSPSDSTTYFVNGLMEEILNNLQKIKDFRVLSRTSTDQYKGKDRPTIPEIAKKLNVSYIVEGSGQKYGNTFILRIQLIKGKGKETHLWAKSYDREIQKTTDIINIQSEIAQLIAGELMATITPEEKQLINKIPTTNLTAYDFYQQGREKYNKGNLIKAEGLFREALKYDSTYARAYVGLSLIYRDKTYNASYLSENFLDSVLILVNKALSFDNQLGEAYTERGRYYFLKGFSERAIEEYDKALKYNSNDFEAYYLKGDTYSALQNLVQAIDNIHKAIARYRGIDLPFYLRELGLNYLGAGFVDKGKSYFKEAFKLDRDSAKYLKDLAWTEWHNEDFTEALKLSKKAYEIDSTKNIDPQYYSLLPASYFQEAYLNAKKWIKYSQKTGDLLLGYNHRIALAFWRMGKLKEAEYYFNQEIKYDEGSINLGRVKNVWGGSDYDLAAIYAFLGDKEKAYKHLDEFDKMKSYPLWWVVFVKRDPFFDGIRDEDHFQKIQQNVEAKYQAEHERVRKWLEEQGMLN